MNYGFFNDDELVDLRCSGMARCATCGLWKSAFSPRMEASGHCRRRIMVVAEAPGEEEDKRGTQLIGPAGQTLRKALTRLHVDLDEDCVKTNAVTCRPPRNATPSNAQIDACRPSLFSTLKQYQPKLVLLLGGTALKAYWGHRVSADKLGKWRGTAVADTLNDCWTFTTYHPSYLMRTKGAGGLETIWMQDLRCALSYLQEPLPEADLEQYVHLFKPRQAVRYLDWLNENGELIAFDYETTGLKPHAEGHRIVSVGVAHSPTYAAAFELDPSSFELQTALERVLTNPKIGKIACNLKFEDHWTVERLGVRVANWQWDTMVAAHILDNRPGITSAKWQAFVRLGVVGYEDKVAPYLKSAEDSGNALNRIAEAPLLELLRYNAMDALVEFRTALQQRKEMLADG